MVGKFGFLAALLPLLASSVLAVPASKAAAAEEYDYIVVGTGPGGGPLAVSLAKANYTVLLLEAGDDALQGGGSYPPAITWDFFVKHYEEEERNLKYHRLTWRLTDGSYWVGPASQPPPEGAELLGVYYPRGATLGGSTMINGMFTFLPPDSDWEYVVNITGDASWSAEEMRRHFVTIEHNYYVPEGTPGHGFNGYFPVNMAKGSTNGSIGAILESAANEIGLDPAQVSTYLNSDPNFLDPERDHTDGIWGLPKHTQRDGSRWSSRHLIEDTLDANQYPLTLQMNSFVSRVLFADADKTTDPAAKPRATGVEIIKGKSVYRADPRNTGEQQGEVSTATARKEVIVAGGAFNSPQLLMVSGVGPAAHLESFGIPVVADLPGVGRNLMDNQEVPIVGLVQSNSTPSASIAVTVITTDHSGAVGGERDVFFSQGQYVFRGFWPDAQSNADLAVDPPSAYGLALVKMRPQNTAGYVRLRSADPLDPPDVNFRLYAEGAETDVGAIRDAAAWARRVFAATAPPHGPVAATEPPCGAAGFDAADGACRSRDEEDDWIYGQTFGHHPTSTCRIGADDDPMAVLDSRFRVRGVDGLRVVDASAFARIPGVFPVVATFMISQKAAETILGENAASR
ncbi:hypothetical protein SLS62_007436 [Diatrype stigma]|uniref:Glucose-methanol-choline oxidoreductase N-terminal domain-containing protein n=1 Tax=Diatrype stigma TaxID=117547 RepID=A0AAN9YQP9_9PEZI